MAFKSKLHGEEDGLGFVRVTRGLLGRKRILISKTNQENVLNSDEAPVTEKIPVKRTKSETKSMLESLHQDILVVEAKKSYFDLSTPKKTLHFRHPLLINEEDYEIEAPNAPIRRRINNRESDLSKISMVLFK
ncbi:hypothetical protein AALP_AA6G214800 [Arabis alpina]|uniref:Uncharacterized protein n=1 Tax=Arabis alpina TaxID=50452 RepID=A0A087GQT1_ARAAL|nr:hypothetical protein AALP_AA6G214800 [Arabis alpina]